MGGEVGGRGRGTGGLAESNHSPELYRHPQLRTLERACRQKRLSACDIGAYCLPGLCRVPPLQAAHFCHAGHQTRMMLKQQRRRSGWGWQSRSATRGGRKRECACFKGRFSSNSHSQLPSGLHLSALNLNGINETSSNFLPG